MLRALLSRTLPLILYVSLWPPFIVMLDHTSQGSLIFGRWSYRFFCVLILYGVCLILIGIWLIYQKTAVLTDRSCLILTIRFLRGRYILPFFLLFLAIALSSILPAMIDYTSNFKPWLLLYYMMIMIVIGLLFLLVGRSTHEKIDILAKMCLMMFGCTICLVILEGIGLLLNLEPLDTWNINPKNLNNVVFRTDEFDSKVTTNNLGLRELRQIEPLHPDIFRIIVIGDSYTFGWGVDDIDTYPYRTEQLLNNRYALRNIQIINMSRAGAGLKDYIKYIRKYASKLFPDLIVIGFLPGNDCPLTETIRFRTPEEVRKDLESYIAESSVGEVKGPVGHFLMKSFVFRVLYRRAYPLVSANLWDRVAGWWEGARSSPIYNEPNPLISSSIRRKISRVKNEEVRAAQERYKLLKDTGWMDKGLRWSISPWLIRSAILAPDGPTDALFLRPEKNPAMETEWDLCTGLLLSIKQVTEELGANLMIFILPSVLQVDREHLNFRRILGFAISYDALQGLAANDLMKEFCINHNVVCMDTLETFRWEIKTRKKLYFERDGHMTSRGNELLGEVLAHRIASLINKADRCCR